MVLIRAVDGGPIILFNTKEGVIAYPMPKATKRAATKRAARIAKAHESELPKLVVATPSKRSSSKAKRQARGIGRYPWAVILGVLLIAASVGSLYYYHIGPFAPPPPVNVKATATVVEARATATTVATSPCSTSTVTKQVTNTAAAPTTAQFNKIQHTYSKAPAMTIDTTKVYCAGLNTSRGLVVLELDPSIAPVTVNNFVFLAQHHFYDGLKFSRVVPNFVIQTGDPKGDNTGGPGYKFNDETVKGDYNEGCVAMANSGTNTNGSQFFICTVNDTKTLTKKYNLFGHVIVGMNIAKKIQGPGDTTASKSITPDILNSVVVVAVNP